MIGAVLNTINTRLDPSTIAFILQHCEAKVLITDREFAPVMAQALRALKAEHGRELVVIDVCDSEFPVRLKNPTHSDSVALFDELDALLKLIGWTISSNWM